MYNHFQHIKQGWTNVLSCACYEASAVYNYKNTAFTGVNFEACTVQQRRFTGTPGLNDIRHVLLRCAMMHNCFTIYLVRLSHHRH